MTDMSERAGRYERSFPGMVGAMIVLVLVVVGFVVFRDASRKDPVTRVEPVEYRQPARYAQKQLDFPLLAPQQLPARSGTRRARRTSSNARSRSVNSR